MGMVRRCARLLLLPALLLLLVLLLLCHWGHVTPPKSLAPFVKTLVRVLDPPDAPPHWPSLLCTMGAPVAEVALWTVMAPLRLLMWPLQPVALQLREWNEDRTELCIAHRDVKDVWVVHPGNSPELFSGEYFLPVMALLLPLVTILVGTVVGRCCSRCLGKSKLNDAPIKPTIYFVDLDEYGEQYTRCLIERDMPPANVCFGYASEGYSKTAFHPRNEVMTGSGDRGASAMLIMDLLAQRFSKLLGPAQCEKVVVLSRDETVRAVVDNLCKEGFKQLEIEELTLQDEEEARAKKDSIIMQEPDLAEESLEEKKAK